MFISLKFLHTECSNPAIYQVVKNPEVPILSRYRTCSDPKFWSKIPFNPMPEVPKAQTCIKIDRLKYWRDISYDKLPLPHKLKLDKVIQDLEYGADACVDESLLPPLFTKNSPSVEEPEVGVLFTDQLVSWLKKGFVLGNFSFT